MESKHDNTDLLFETMGEENNTYVVDQFLSEEDRRRQELFVKVAVGWFAEEKMISWQQAFVYLQKHQGIKFLQENYECEQTLPKKQILEDLVTICNNPAS